MTILNADRWLYDKLTTDSQLSAVLGGRVYADVAPQTTQYPLAILTLVSAQQISNLYSDKVMDVETWQIAVWTDKPSYTDIEPIADRVREILHKAGGTGVLAAVYQSQQRMMEQDGDKEYKAIILEFKIFVQ
jgi:hypothetical protein